MNQIDRAVEILCKKQHGLMSELEQVLEPMMIRKLEAMGYIINAPGVQGKTWRVSQSAKRYYKAMFRGSSLAERLKGVYIRKVCSVDLSF